MIKPDDVPKSLVYDVCAQMKKCLELDELGTPVSTQQQIADLLNLCVESGVVSPPCWDVVADDYRVRMVFKTREDADLWKQSEHGFDHLEVRHWKGD